MKKDSRSLIFALPILILAFAATVMRTVACFIHMDYNSGFFGNTLLVHIADYLAVALVLVLFVYLFIKVEKRSPIPSFSGPAVYLPNGVLAMSILFLSAELIGYVSGGNGGFFESLFSDRSRIVALITALFALVAIAYIALVVFITSPRSLIRAEFGMLAAIFFGLYTTFVFFRTGAPINQPQRILSEMTSLSAALFILEETRISLGRERWRGYFVLGALTSVLSLYTAFPALLVYLFRGEVVSSSIAELIFTLALLVFSVSRLIHVSRLSDGTPSPLAAAIDARGELHTVEESEEEDPSQISIEDVAYDERQAENEEDTGN